MHAIRQHELGGPDVLRLDDLADPLPEAGQVRIKVHAAGVHLVDTFIRRGEFHALPGLPTVPGREVAGVVDRVGAGVDLSWVGVRVVTHLGPVGGGYAELAVVDVSRIHRVDATLPFTVAVAAIGTGRTAVGVLDHVELSGDDVVVVTAASGGLGSVLVRAAQHAGATVVGLAGGPDKVRHVAGLGVPIVVDYRAAGWDGAVRRALCRGSATIVLDGVGGDVSHTAYDLLVDGGLMVNYSGADPSAYDRTSRRMLSPLGPDWMDVRPGGLRGAEAEALAAAVDGSRRPVVGTTFALSDAAEAHRALEERRTVGKVVLVPYVTA